MTEERRRYKVALSRVQELKDSKGEAERKIQTAQTVLNAKRQTLIEKGVMGEFSRLSPEQQTLLDDVVMDREQEELLYLESEKSALTEAKAQLLEVLLQLEKWEQELMLCEYALERAKKAKEKGDDDEQTC